MVSAQYHVSVGGVLFLKGIGKIQLLYGGRVALSLAASLPLHVLRESKFGSFTERSNEHQRLTTRETTGTVTHRKMSRDGYLGYSYHQPGWH